MDIKSFYKIKELKILHSLHIKNNQKIKLKYLKTLN